MAQKFHFAFTVYNADSDGSVVEITRRQAEYLVQRGHQVTLVTNRMSTHWSGVTAMTTPGEYSQFWRRANYFAEGYSRHIPSALKMFSLNRVIEQLRFSQWAAVCVRSLSETQPVHAVVACQHVCSYGLARLRSERRIPYVITSHGDVFEHPFRAFSLATHVLYRSAARHAARNADLMITVSNRLREGTCQLGRGTLRTTTIPNGIDLADFDEPQREAKQCSLPAYLLAVGRLSHEKGIDVLLRSLCLLKDRSIQLQIAGDGAERSRLEALAKTLGIDNRVHFLGRKPKRELADWYQNAKLVVMPSRSDAMPLAALEAQAFGKAIVATRVGGIPEIINDEKSGKLVRPNDPALLAEAIDGLLGDDQRRIAMESAARRNVQRFSWPILLEQFENEVVQLAQQYFPSSKSISEHSPSLTPSSVQPAIPISVEAVSS